MSANTGTENSVRVLVIEDNADDRELLLRQLTKSGMASHVKFIDDGQVALDFMTGPQSPSLARELIAILLDLRLPSLSGLEFLRRIRQAPEFQAIPIIVMTSSNDPKDLEECQRYNVRQYVSKPVTYSTFSKAVADVFHTPKSTQSIEPAT